MSRQVLKTTILLLILFACFIQTFAQQKIKGKIVDIHNGVAISEVVLLNISDDSKVVSNQFGEFFVNKKGRYLVSINGYETKEIEVLSSAYFVIQLTPNPLELNEIIVSANQIPQKILKAVSTIAVISNKEINRGNNYNISSVINRVSGVFMQSGALNTNKITIRGIGSRNLYGTSKIRAYFQDIPLTSGNGETTIEDFELNSIARFEINKGTGSSIYGAGLGGTIHLTPKYGNLNETEVASELSLGSFGLIKTIVNLNHGSKNNGVHVIYSNTHSDGYRENNSYDRQTVTLSSNHFLGEKNYLTILASYVALKAFIPSSIDRETYEDNPSKAAFTWGSSQGYEDSQRGIFGLSWNHQYNHKTKHITSVFTSFRNAYEPRPFNILAENTLAMGIRSRLLGQVKLFDKKLKWTIGGELFKDIHDLETFENLYQDYPLGTGSVKGTILSDFEENRSYYNVFMEANYEVTPNTMLSLGLNFNETKYILDDNFTETGDIDQSGSYSFGTMLSPKVGISHVFFKNNSVYANVSHGFSPPTISETLLPNGLINNQIQPETGWNYEVGTRAALLENRMQINLAIYRMDIKNLIVAHRTSEDQFIGVNAGKTQHDGLEITLNYDWIQKENFTLRNYFSYSLNDFKFTDFNHLNQDFSGNQLPGVPSDVFNMVLEGDSKIGIYGNINFQYVGAMPLTDVNLLYSDSYKLTNIKMGYKFSIQDKIKLNLFFGLDNIFNETYSSQILINAKSFDGKQPRYFYPGYPVNYYSGIRINYMF